MMTNEQRDAIRARLAQLATTGSGRLTPEAVVEDAKNAASPLHGCFEWDAGKAAYQHWLDQARTLITSVHVVQRTDKTQVRTVYYVRDPSAQNKDQGYVSTDALRKDSDMARAAIVAEFKRAADVLRRAKHLAIALGAEDDVDWLIEGVVQVRQRFESASEKPVGMAMQ